MTFRPLCAAGYFALLCSACGKPPAADQVTRRTIADTTFVSSPADGVDGPASLEEITHFEAARLDLGRVDAGAFGSNGSIWLYDAQGKHGEQLRLFDSLGAPLADAGRAGSGPGEYRNPARIFALADGALLLKEMSTTRAVRFSAAGAVLATIELPAIVATGWVVTPDTSGGWYITASFEDHTPARVGRYGWLHFNRDGAVTDTVLAPAKFFEEPTPDGVAPGRIRTVGRDGAMLTTVPGPSRLTRIARDGKVTAMEWRAEPPMYSEQERKDIQVVEDKMNELFGKPHTPLPERKEPAHRILTDGAGLIWAQLSTVGDRIPDEELPKNANTPIPPDKWRDRDRWAAFDATGVLQFTVALPAGTTVLDRSGRRLLGATVDADGNQRIVVWRVVPQVAAQH